MSLNTGPVKVLLKDLKHLKIVRNAGITKIYRKKKLLGIYEEFTVKNYFTIAGHGVEFIPQRSTTKRQRIDKKRREIGESVVELDCLGVQDC